MMQDHETEITVLLLNVHGHGEHETRHLEWDGMVERVCCALIAQGHYYGTEDEQREAARKNAVEVLQAGLGSI